MIAILDRLGRRKKLKTIGIAVLAVGAVAGGAMMLQKSSRPPEIEVPPPPHAIASDDITPSLLNRVVPTMVIR